MSKNRQTKQQAEFLNIGQMKAKEEFEKFKENLNNQLLISSSGFSCASTNPAIPGDPKAPNAPQIAIIGSIQQRGGIDEDSTFFGRGPFGHTPLSDEEEGTSRSHR